MSKPPLPVETLSQALVNAGVADGFRQGLADCAKNLQAQAEAWRAQAKQQVKAAGLSPAKQLRARMVQQQTEAWCKRLDMMADHILKEHRARESEAKQLRKVAETLLSAFEQAGKKRKGWFPWR
jgi:hypothetical protein